MYEGTEVEYKWGLRPVHTVGFCLSQTSNHGENWPSWLKNHGCKYQEALLILVSVVAKVILDAILTETSEMRTLDNNEH